MPLPFVLIAFRFPPYDRIGAYRWSKLSGRLARLGHSIDVVTVRWANADDPGWFKEVEHENVRVHRLPSFYPHRLRAAQFEARLLQKAQGRLFGWLDRASPGHDVASLWGHRLLPYVARLLEDRASPLMVATGAPFSSNFWAARLRCATPRARLIQDFRDPWLTGPEEVQGDEGARFDLATKSADLLVSVTPEMSALFQRLSGHERVETVPNGVELRALRETAWPTERRYDFAYIGNLYNRRDETLARFLDWVRAKKQAEPMRQREAPRVVIAGLHPNALGTLHADLIASGHLTLLPQLPQHEAFALIAASRFALHLNGPGSIGTFQTTTKLVEHAGLGRPTLSLNYGGASETFIRQQGLGFSLRADSPELDAELDARWRAEQPFELDVAEFDFDRTAAKYSALIDGLAIDGRAADKRARTSS